MTPTDGDEDVRALEYTSSIESRRPSRTIGVIAMMPGGIGAVIQIAVMNIPWAVLTASDHFRVLECVLLSMPVSGYALAFVGTKLRSSDRRFAGIACYVNLFVLEFHIAALFLIARGR